jgi:hypothetical protein
MQLYNLNQKDMEITGLVNFRINETSDVAAAKKHQKHDDSTRMTQRQRGRVQDAAPALVRN